MPDFEHVPAPTFSPTCCVACSTHRHDRGFVDLAVEGPVFGHDQAGNPVVPPGRDFAPSGRLYLCASCVDQAARKVGCLDPEQAQAFAEASARDANRIVELEARLAAEEANKVVSLADARTMLGLTVSSAPEPVRWWGDEGGDAA